MYEHRLIILLGDGMADYPVDSLGGLTPLEAAKTPNMDYMAKNGLSGLVKTIPNGMKPGSDTANLSIFGYDPEKFYTGRAPLEAINMDITLGPDDAAFRCNIVSIGNNIMEDFSGGHIDTAFTRQVIGEISQGINIEGIEFYPGVSYRNILIWRNYPYKNITGSTPPHDIQGKNIFNYLPQGEGSEVLIKIMEESKKIIRNSLLIKKLRNTYKGDPDSVWLWGGGKKPKIRTLKEIYGLQGHTISAVDLIHGIGKAAGLTPIPVKGATGYIDTNYEGKAEALFKGIKESNFIYLHVESPDESGHQGNLNHKMRSIEDFDKKIVGPVLKEMKKNYKNFTIAVLPDHPTPLQLRTHTSDPVPFCIYKNRRKEADPAYQKVESYSEKAAKSSGLYLAEGHKFIDFILTKI